MSIPTIEEFEAAGPDVVRILGKTAEELSAICEGIPDPPEDPVPPEIGKTELNALKTIVFTKHSVDESVRAYGAGGGWPEIAAAVGLWPDQCEEMARQMAAIKAVNDSKKVPE